MPISDKTRKMLWGKSGNRCAMCKRELVLPSTTNNDESVVGEECHILSPHGNGPRHDPSLGQDMFDSVDNLILLCRVHHKQVDDQVETFTAEILQQMKENHEKWVRRKLADDEIEPVRLRRVKKNIPSAMVHLTTATQVLNLALSSYGVYINHDEPRSSDEVSLVGGFLQDVRDLADLSGDMEPLNQVEAAYELSQTMRQLEAAGFMVFGASEVQLIGGGVSAAPDQFPMLHLSVLHSDNPAILFQPLNEAKRTD